MTRPLSEPAEYRIAKQSLLTTRVRTPGGYRDGYPLPVIGRLRGVLRLRTQSPVASEVPKLLDNLPIGRSWTIVVVISARPGIEPESAPMYTQAKHQARCRWKAPRWGVTSPVRASPSPFLAIRSIDTDPLFPALRHIDGTSLI